MRGGLAGKISHAFITSPLTPLVIVAASLLGVFSIWQTPREEEPQIVVPMLDVFVNMPGTSAAEVEQRRDGALGIHQPARAECVAHALVHAVLQRDVNVGLERRQPALADGADHIIGAGERSASVGRGDQLRG